MDDLLSAARPARRLDRTPHHGLVSVPDVPPEPKPLFCRLQGLGVTVSRSPTPLTPGPPYPTERAIFRGNLTIKFDHQILAADARTMDDLLSAARPASPDSLPSANDSATTATRPPPTL